MNIRLSLVSEKVFSMSCSISRISSSKNLIQAWLGFLSRKIKAGKVTAADIKTSGGVEILNKDLYITEIDRDGFELDIQIRVEKNVGYKSIETLKKEDDDVMILVVDASFSPVLNVSTEVTSERYGDMTDLDRLSLTIKTNGSITPESALKFGSQMLRSYFDIFCDSEVVIESEFMGDVRSLREKEKKDAQATEHRENFTHRFSRPLSSLHSMLSSMETSSLSNSSKNAQKQNSALSKASERRLWMRSVLLSQHRTRNFSETIKPF